jgi:hypothetical protein
MHRHIGSIEVLSLRRLRAIELLRANRLEESDDELAVSVEAIGSVRDLLIDLFTANKTRPSRIPGLSLRKGTASERRGKVRLGLSASIRSIWPRPALAAEHYRDRNQSQRRCIERE